MILVADAGNTNIKLGIYDGDKLVIKTRMSTGVSKSPDDYIHDILNTLHKNKINTRDIDCVAVSTVVPKTTQPFIKGAKKLFCKDVLVVNKDTKTNIKIKIDNPEKVGADRIVNSAAAAYYYGGPAIIIDFGTATTYDVISEKDEFLGGIIAPGIKICAQALYDKTAKLPKIEVEKPPSIMGTNTVNSMKSGVFYGYIGQVEYLVKNLKLELKTDFKVIATGGLCPLFEGNTDCINIYDSDLTLKGLNYLSILNNR